MTPDAPADKIVDVLAAERRALRSGNLAALEELVADREAALAMLSRRAATMDPADLRRIADAAEANRVLLDAAMSGVRQAMRRVAELRTLAAGSGTYDARGHRKSGLAQPRLTLRR